MPQRFTLGQKKAPNLAAQGFQRNKHSKIKSPYEITKQEEGVPVYGAAWLIPDWAFPLLCPYYAKVAALVWWAIHSALVNSVQISMMAVPATTMAELISVACSSQVAVTIATAAVCKAPTMPDTRANTFLLIFFMV